MATRAHEIVHPFGVIEMEHGRITQIEEKPKIMTDINAGIYVLSPSAFASIHSIARDQFDRTALFIELLNAHPGKVKGFPMYEDWIDVGKESDLLKANKRRS
jgi:NDP-sugar pyrophosphorylase family protein